MKCFLSRQAIFDKDINVIGYEVVFRDGFANIIQEEFNELDQSNPDSIAALSNLLFTLGIGTITFEKKAFIHFTPTLLVERIATFLPWENLGIIVDTPQSYDEKILDNCLELKRRGYTIILDHFKIEHSDERYLSVASYIRMSSNELDPSTKASLQFLTKNDIKLLASHVEFYIQYNSLVLSGFTLFQGNFYSRLRLIAGKEIPGIRIHYLQLMQEVLKPEIKFTVVEDIINKDVALSSELLKIVNSAAFGFRKKITSVRQALVIIGAEEIKKWVSLVTIGHLGQYKPDELLKRALFRARFCELLSKQTELTAPSPDLFLLGMFSLIDAFVDKPLDEVLDLLPLSDDIKDAIQKNTGSYTQIYSMVLHYEACNWDELFKIATGLRINQDELPKIYSLSLEWVRQIFS